MHVLPPALAITFAVCAASAQANPQYRFDNGQWFRDGAFAPATVYVEDGRLRFSDTPLEAGRVVDLKGRYVVPPFCEGHNHDIGGSVEDIDETIQSYLEKGIFYAMMPGSFAFYREQIADRLNRPDSIDVAFANNGLTGPGGHPRGLREMLMERFGRYPEFTQETLPDKGYFEAATVEDVREKYALIRAERPDFIKVMLYFSEEFEARKDDPEFYGSRGLDPALLPEVVRLAHADGLRVAVHVESEADMVTALEAGADIIAHLPSYDAPVVLSDETIALAVRTQAALVTSFMLARRVERRDPEQYAAIIEAQKTNLTRLHAAGARLVVGSDFTRGSVLQEASHLHSLGVLDTATLLTLWTDNCADMVFPERKIGRLQDGYEASFLVLERNPLEDFSAVTSIAYWMKEGSFLAPKNRGSISGDAHLGGEMAELSKEI